MTEDTSKDKIGVVLVTHGNLATELVKVMEHVVGPQTQLTTITIGPDDDMEQRREDILSSVQLRRSRTRSDYTYRYVWGNPIKFSNINNGAG